MKTPNLVVTAHRANSDQVFQQVAKLYLRQGMRIADLTFGQGNWWQLVKKSDYRLIKQDLAGGHDARHLRFDKVSLDAVCFDPPFLRNAATSYVSQPRFRKNYGLDFATSLRTHDDLLRLYGKVAQEAFRVLKPDGLFIVKCQDAASGGRQRFTHIELVARFSELGFRPLDLFVLMQRNTPRVPPQNLHQRFARKNHSYFLIFEKPVRRRAPNPIKWS